MHETPLSEDQSLHEENDTDTLTITAIVADTPRFKWWLLGFGDCVEVLTSPTLRHDLSQAAAKINARYMQTDDSSSPY